jgi:hypothetical protein
MSTAYLANDDGLTWTRQELYCHRDLAHGTPEELGCLTSSAWIRSSCSTTVVRGPRTTGTR